MAFPRRRPSSQVERSQAAARLAALATAVGVHVFGDTETLVQQVRGVTPAEERATIDARLRALEKAVEVRGRW